MSCLTWIQNLHSSDWTFLTASWIHPPAAAAHVSYMSNENWQKCWISGLVLHCAACRRSYMITPLFPPWSITVFILVLLFHIHEAWQWWFRSRLSSPWCQISAINHNTLNAQTGERAKPSFLMSSTTGDTKASDTIEIMPPDQTVPAESFTLLWSLSTQNTSRLRKTRLVPQTLCE